MTAVWTYGIGARLQVRDPGTGRRINGRCMAYRGVHADGTYHRVLCLLAEPEGRLTAAVLHADGRIEVRDDERSEVPPTGTLFPAAAIAAAA